MSRIEPDVLFPIQNVNGKITGFYTGMNLTNLPPIWDNMRVLVCSENYLTKLPLLPPNLRQLYCSYNQLTELPLLPEGLKILRCSNNQLTELPLLPDELRVLSCSNNTLKHLPLLPVNLSELDCSNNILNELPVLPSGLEYLECSQTNGLEKEQLICNRIGRLILTRKVYKKLLRYIRLNRINLFAEISGRPPGIVGEWDKGGQKFIESLNQFDEFCLTEI